MRRRSSEHRLPARIGRRSVGLGTRLPLRFARTGVARRMAARSPQHPGWRFRSSWPIRVVKSPHALEPVEIGHGTGPDSLPIAGVPSLTLLKGLQSRLFRVSWRWRVGAHGPSAGNVSAPYGAELWPRDGRSRTSRPPTRTCAATWSRSFKEKPLDRIGEPDVARVLVCPALDKSREAGGTGKSLGGTADDVVGRLRLSVGRIVLWRREHW